MVRYRRHRVPGGTFFFTVTLSDRRSRALVEHVGALRLAVRTARVERPFTIDAVVILPDHLHAIFSLPPGDADFSGRWRRIKSLFTRQVRSTERLDRSPNGEYGLWQRRFWEHTIKHGLVLRVRDWPHSSFHRYLRMGWLAEDWGGDGGDLGGGFGEPAGS